MSMFARFTQAVQATLAKVGAPAAPASAPETTVGQPDTTKEKPFVLPAPALSTSARKTMAAIGLSDVQGQGVDLAIALLAAGDRTRDRGIAVKAWMDEHKVGTFVLAGLIAEYEALTNGVGDISEQGKAILAARDAGKSATQEQKALLSEFAAAKRRRAKAIDNSLTQGLRAAGWLPARVRAKVVQEFAPGQVRADKPAAKPTDKPAGQSEAPAPGVEVVQEQVRPAPAAQGTGGARGGVIETESGSEPEPVSKGVTLAGAVEAANLAMAAGQSGDYTKEEWENLSAALARLSMYAKRMSTLAKPAAKPKKVTAK